MTNKFRGVIVKTFYDEELEQDRTVKFVMDYNAIALLEEILEIKKGTDLIYRLGMGDVSTSEVIAVYYATMKRHQPDATYEDAGDVMSYLPDAWVEILNSAFPAVTDKAETKAPTGKKPKRQTKSAN